MLSYRIKFFVLAFAALTRNICRFTTRWVTTQTLEYRWP